MIPAVHIEEDMRALLRTGLFSSVSMRPAPPSPAAELSFLVDSQVPLAFRPAMWNGHGLLRSH